MDKRERLAALKGEKPEPSHALRNEEIHVYGDTAVHRFVDGSEWVLEVWHREKGEWRVVAAQVNFGSRERVFTARMFRWLYYGHAPSIADKRPNQSLAVTLRAF